jgi:citrate synthase
MIDLGFKPAQAVVLFQLANAPGLAAHGLDLAGRPLNAVPFVPDEEYYFE